MTVAGLLLGACSLRTAGAPKGDLELTATFDDVGNLVVGHAVQVADVTVGTVTAIELDGYRATVTMQVDDTLELPTNTVAVLAKTSLLGENYVELRPPPDGQAEDGLLASGDAVADTRLTPEFEQVTERAIEFLGALSADDLQTIVSTGAEALGGRGEELNELLDDLTTVVVDLNAQKAEIARTIDGFAAFTEDLADNEGEVTTLVDTLADASVTLAANRDRLIGALRGMRDLARVTTDEVLTPHADTLAQLIRDLDPVVATLAEERPTIEALLASVNRFLVAIADNVTSLDAQAQYIWAKGLTTPSGNVGEGGGGPTPGGGGGPPVPTEPPPEVTAAVDQSVQAVLTILGDLTEDLDRLSRRELRRVCTNLGRLGIDLDRVCDGLAGAGRGGGGRGQGPGVTVPDLGGPVGGLLPGGGG